MHVSMFEKLFDHLQVQLLVHIAFNCISFHVIFIHRFIIHNSVFHTLLYFSSPPLHVPTRHRSGKGLILPIKPPNLISHWYNSDPIRYYCIDDVSMSF
jgi:hypothetical protein